MSKRIVICADGTWNTPDQKNEGVISPTNVARLAMCVTPFAGDGRRQGKGVKRGSSLALTFVTPG